jgi:hypothetical protein
VQLDRVEPFEGSFERSQHVTVEGTRFDEDGPHASVGETLDHGHLDRPRSGRTVMPVPLTQRQGFEQRL